jgi:DNA-binding SARP family transcriptional activator/DNA-binding transcriptional ArsR family regulator
VLHITTFGGLQIERDGPPLDLPSRTARHLLAYLILHHDRSLARDLLGGTFWPDRSNALARRALSQALWQIRTALGPSADRVVAEPEHVTFTLQPGDRLDVTDFETAIRSDDPAQLREAVALYQADFLEGCYADWALLERERLREQYLAALERLVVLHKRRGDFEAALQLAQQLVAADPLRETAHQECMRLYHLLDRSRAALAQYQALCEILAEEMDAEPLPRTAQLAREIAAALATDAPSHLPFPTPEAPALERTSALPLVGREAERAALLAHLERAIGGQGTLVLIEGEAGVGKTRLLEALAEGADWREVPVCRGRGRELTGALPYGVLREALRQALTPLRISQILRLLEPTWLQEASRVLPTLAERLPALPPLPKLGPDQQRQRLVEGLCRLVLALGEVTPHVLILDDLQWADESTLAVLHSLVQRLSESRVLIVGAYRSAEARARPELWEALQALDRAGEHPRLLLARLTVEQTGELVRRGLGLIDQAPRFERRLYQETAGNPLFVLETLRALHDEGLLYRDEDGDWSTPWDQAASGYATMPLPSGVQEIVGQRLSRLNADERALLEVAAVLGDTFDFDLLAQTATDAPERLLTLVDSLIRRQWLVEGPRAYHFNHDMVRQGIYARIEAAARRRLHRRAGRAVEALHPEQVERLAHHYVAAGERSPALHYLRRAAENARRLFAHQSALNFYDQLLGILSRPEDGLARFDVLRDRAETLSWMGRREAQGQTLEEMLDLARTLSDEAHLIDTLHQRSMWHRLQGRYERAKEDALAALAICRRLEDDHAQADILSQLGWSVIYTAEASGAAGYFREALTLYETTGDLDGQIDCLDGLMSLAEERGDYARSLDYCRRCMALAEESGDVRHLCRSAFSMGLICFDLGDVDAADAHLRRALRLSEATGDRRRQAATLFYLAKVPTERGDFEAALTHLENALEIFREIEDPAWAGDVIAALGRLALLRSDPAVAAEHLRTAHRRRSELGEPAYAVIDLSYLARAELALGHEESAWEHSQEAVRALEAGLSGVELPQRIYYNHYRIAEATRRWSIARSALAQAASILNDWVDSFEDPTQREKVRTGHRVNRAITEASARLTSGKIRIRLPVASAPLGRPLRDDEYVNVIWTVELPEDENIPGRIARRRHRIRRLLREAAEQSAAPTVHDLAEALDVSARTIERDLAALRDAGYEVRTRGTRS